MEETPFAPRRLFLPLEACSVDHRGVRLALPIGCLVGASWAAAGPLDHRIVIEDARLASGEEVDILVTDGVIESIGPVEPRAGDVLVRARGGTVLAGRRRAFETTPSWSELIEGPALGFTSVQLPVTALERDWLTGVRERSAWIGPRLATGTDSGPRPRISCGFPAEILVLDPNSRALSQAVIGDHVVRRADLETRRMMIGEARRGIASLPPADAGLRAFRMDAAGLSVGRVEVRPDGLLIRERTVAPQALDRTWDIEPGPEGWTVFVRESDELLATIRSDASGVTAEDPEGHRILLPEAQGWPSVDLMATAIYECRELHRLPEAGTLERAVVDLSISPEGLTLSPDRIQFRRLCGTRSPIPVKPSEQAFEVGSSAGRRGLVVLGPDGFPVRAWETTPAGDLEWVSTPLKPAWGPELVVPATQPP